MKQVIKAMITFWKKETVLMIAVILAAISMVIIPPDLNYIFYIDFRTLGILFCLMAVVAGMKQIHVFDRLAQGLLAQVRGSGGIVLTLVLLCFFLSMLITNDVALITFVPFTIIIMKQLGEKVQRTWMLRVVVMQTIAANLGSMLTPIGNPQNLYLYGKAGIGIPGVLRLMLPYTGISLLLLGVWIAICVGREKFEKGDVTEGKTLITEKNQELRAGEDQSILVREADTNRRYPIDKKKLGCYLALFLVSLLSVAHILPFPIPLLLVIVYISIRDRTIWRQIDYSLLGTFTALFIFIGNVGRIPAFSRFLQEFINGREVITAVIASQVMSNVPAAILLSGFTDNIQALIVGTNLGGLGTLIASMASLISFKYIAKENRKLRGKYFILFTIANVIFLVILLGFWMIYPITY